MGPRPRSGATRVSPSRRRRRVRRDGVAVAHRRGRLARACPGRAEELALPLATPIADLLAAILELGTVTVCSQCAARREIGRGRRTPRRAHRRCAGLRRRSAARGRAGARLLTATWTVEFPCEETARDHRRRSCPRHRAERADRAATTSPSRRSPPSDRATSTSHSATPIPQHRGPGRSRRTTAGSRSSTTRTRSPRRPAPTSSTTAAVAPTPATSPWQSPAPTPDRSSTPSTRTPTW